MIKTEVFGAKYLYRMVFVFFLIFSEVYRYQLHWIIQIDIDFEIKCDCLNLQNCLFFFWFVLSIFWLFQIISNALNKWDKLRYDSTICDNIKKFLLWLFIKCPIWIWKKEWSQLFLMNVIVLKVVFITKTCHSWYDDCFR